ncbi:MAG: LysR family transcriptional regulator [Rhodobacteraceae bacterium]|nr:LysR family transcriptional regulator [Paracoccaceae bacterium]
MTIAQLKAFHAVATEGSIQKAAELLKLTQPAVSIQIKALEQGRQVNLFRRNGHDLRLSPNGQALFEATSRLLRAQRDANDILTSAAGGMSGTLVLGADGPHVALDLVAKFRQQNPNVRVELRLANADTTWDNLLQLRVDAAVMAGARPDANVIRHDICRQSMVALLRRDHRLAGEQELTMATLAGHDLIFRETGSSTQQKVNAALRDLGMLEQPKLEVSSREGVIEAVKRGMGIGFAYENEAPCDGRLTAIPITNMTAINTDQLLCLKAQMSNPFVKSLFSLA